MALTGHGPPRWRHLAVESPRALWALAGLPFRWRGLLSAPYGDGRPVFLLPGLFNTDRSNVLLARYLRAIGYRVEGWGLGRNLGQRTIGGDGRRLFDRIECFADESGAPVALVGVSLGGIMARLAAHRLPGRVAQVVTVASPFAGAARDTRVWRLYQFVSGERVDDPAVLALAAEARRPLRIPTTAIWSRSDGLVNGMACHDPTDSAACAVEVASGHYGVQTRPEVLRAVAMALAGSPGVRADTT